MEPLTYRLFDRRDVPGLLRLWTEHSGWGPITEEQWRQWFLETPQGACLVVVAVDAAGDVAGQGVFTPARLEVAGRQLRALRVSAPVLHPGLRSTSIRQRRHPAVQMLLTARSAAIDSGFDVIYGLPDHAWLPFFRWMPRVGLPDFAAAEYDCMSLPLNEVSARLGSEVTTRYGVQSHAAPGFGEDYEALWQSAKATFPVQCGVIRDPGWVRFRNGGRIAIEVRDRPSGRLAGYVAFKRQGHLVADILARCPGDLLPVLAAGVSELAQSSNSTSATVTAMATPMLLPALTALQFTPTDFRFAFVCHSLRDDMAPAALAPDRWYVTPGD